jgi:hypothetical protein
MYIFASATSRCASFFLSQIKAAGAAMALIAMYFTGHIQRAYDRGGEGDGSIPMLSAFLVFMCMSVMSVDFCVRHVCAPLFTQLLQVQVLHHARSQLGGVCKN